MNKYNYSKNNHCRCGKLIQTLWAKENLRKCKQRHERRTKCVNTV